MTKLLLYSASILKQRLSPRVLRNLSNHANALFNTSLREKNHSFAYFSSARPDNTASDGAVTTKLRQLIAKGEAQSDMFQLEAAADLDQIHDDLMANEPPPLSTVSSDQVKSSSASSFFGGLFGGGKSSAMSGTLGQAFSAGKPSIKGAYMFGGVGCGKTFLMNLLYDAVDSGAWAEDKQKVHYHKFMLQVHQHMHEQRKLDPHGDLITPVVDQVLRQGRLLCLDEFQVTDVADALILQRLFDGLWINGCVVVATSNRPPSDLYLNGIQRDRFLPFIDRVQENCVILDLLDSDTDYRIIAGALGQQSIYFSKGQSKEFKQLFFKLTEGHPTNPTSLSTQGRQVPIPLASTHKRVAHFDFSDLCQKALGAADYLVIANHFSTVFCQNVPKLTVNEINWLRRFITFVDTMYELNVTLILHTHAESVDEIFVVEGSKESYSQDEVFAFDRTRSRLEEMASTKYLKSQWLGGGKKKRDGDQDVHKVSTRVVIHPSLDDHIELTDHSKEETQEAIRSTSSR